LEKSGVEVLDEVDQAALVLVRVLLLLVGPLVVEDHLEALVEERHGLQPLEHGASDELGALGGEDRGVRPERDRCPGCAAALGRVTDDAELALRLAALGELLEVALAVAVDLDRQPLGQGVDDGDTDAVETAGHLVAAAPELAAGVEHGQHHLGRRLALVWTRRVGVDRNAAAVVVDSAATVGHQGDDDPCAEARHRLVDGVVDDLPDQVMETGETRRTDVHARALADGVEPFQNLDVLGAVFIVGHALPHRFRGAKRVPRGLPDAWSAGRSGNKSHACESTSGVSQRGSISVRSPMSHGVSLRSLRSSSGDCVADPAPAASHR
jgi:hypothetical protein